jgi:hypothetical protein
MLSGTQSSVPWTVACISSLSGDIRSDDIWDAVLNAVITEHLVAFTSLATILVKVDSDIL